MSTITPSDSTRLAALERTIEAGRKTFVEVGLALAEIRDSRLYRAHFKTFEDYCREKWGWQRQRAYELIEAAQVTKALPEKCNKIITNDYQASALAAVPEEKRVEVLEKVAEQGPVTARAIHEAVQEPYKPSEAITYRVSVDVARDQINQIIRHRPLKKNSLLAIAKLFKNAAKKCEAFAKKAKE